MTCIDFFGKLNPADRAECWNCFVKMTGIFSDLKNKKNSAETAAAYRVPAEEINRIFEKNGIKMYFDTGADDEHFLRQLIDEMDNVGKMPRQRD